MGEKELKKLVIFLGIVVLIAVLGSAGVILYLVGRNNDPLPDGHDILVYHVDNTYSDLNDRYCKARKLTITDEKRRLEYSDLKDVANLDGVLEIYYLDDMKANRLMKMYDMDPRITVSVPEALIRQFKDPVGSRGWFELKEGSAPRDHAKEIVLPETWLPSGKQVGDLIDYSGEVYVLSGINGAEAAWVSYTDGENSIFERYDPETYPEFESADWNQTAVINASEELDGAGEYWIDSDTKIFYVYDPSGDCHFTGGGDMVTVNKANYLTFRGLDFKNSDGYMINASGHPRGMTLDGCKFVGCSAKLMVSIAGGTAGVPLDVTVKGCEFSNCASTALLVGGYNTNDIFGTCSGVLIDNNLFTLTCLRDGNNGALRLRAPFAVVSHNEFRKCFWEGIDFRKCVNMTAEYNVFDQVCYNGDDTGAINNWNSVDRCGNVVRYNLFIDIMGGTNGRFCLYLDDTAGTEVYSNVFYQVGVTAMNNGVSKYNEFRNNVIVNPEKLYGIGCDPKINCTQTVEGAMEAGDPSIITNHEQYVRWQNAYAFFDSHPDAKAKAEELWPGYFDISLDLDDWQKPEFCMNSSLVITGNVEINKGGTAREYDETISKYSVIEDNHGYSIEENPLFVNPTLGDYRLKSGVDFPDYHFEEIGRY